MVGEGEGGKGVKHIAMEGDYTHSNYNVHLNFILLTNVTSIKIKIKKIFNKEKKLLPASTAFQKKAAGQGCEG